MILRESNDRAIFWLTVAAGAMCIAAATYLIRIEYFGAGLVFIAGSSLILSSITHIRIGKSGVYFTLSEVLVFVWFVLFGAGTATLLAAAEAICASLLFSRKHAAISIKGAAAAGSIAATATFGTSLTVERLFGKLPEAAALIDDASLIVMLAVMVGAQFAFRSVLLAVHADGGPASTVRRVWFDRCLNGFALYVIGGLFAGMILRATHGRDLLLIMAGLLIGSVVFFTYRRHAKEVRESLERAEVAERGRAREARAHVKVLESQIVKLEKAEKELSQSEARFRRAAYHDPMTDLPNRRFLDLELEKAFGRIRKTHSYSFAVVYIDLNRFGSINESLGREIADEFLVGIAGRLTGLARRDDFLARLSGDEFVMLLADVSGESDALEFAELINSKLAVPFNISGKILFAAATAGIAICNSAPETADPLRNSWIAMQEAKAAEKPFLVFSDEMYRTAMSRLRIESDLSEALENGEIIPFFQPIVDLKKMRTAGFEALVRWKHPERGLIGPGEFVPVCEANGTITSITTRMLEESCRTLAEWQEGGDRFKDLFVSVNLSAKDFVQEDLVEKVTAYVDAFGIAPGNLKLEITESAIMNNSEKAAELLKRFKQLGFRLSIDDFGTGYSSLSYLHKFPVDMLKIDRSFVSSMEFGSENGEIVRTVITLAKLLDMKIISEGIETIHQLHQLKILDCEYGQGNLFSVPVPANEAYAILNDRRRWESLDPGAIRNAPLPVHRGNPGEFQHQPPPAG